MEKQVNFHELFWLLGFFSAEGSILFDRARNTDRIIFDICQKEQNNNDKQSNQNIAIIFQKIQPFGFKYSFTTKTGVVHWRMKKKQNTEIFTQLLFQYSSFLCPKKLKKLQVLVQTLHLKTKSIVGTPISFSLEQICLLFPLDYLCFFVLGLWEGDGGVCFSIHKNSKTYKNYQIRLTQQPDSFSNSSYLLFLFQIILSQFANQKSFISTNQKLGTIEWTSSQKRYLRWRTNNKKEVFILLNFFETYPPSFRQKPIY